MAVLIHREAFALMAHSKENRQDDEREHYTSVFCDANVSHAFISRLFWEMTHV